MPARRACANAVSAYESCSVVCASLSSAKTHPNARACRASVKSRSWRAGSPSISIATPRCAAASNTSVPVRDHPGPRSGDPAARVRENSNRRVLKRGEHAIRLIVVLPQLGVRRRQHDVEGGRLVVGEIELTRGVDVRFDTLQQAESTAVPCVDSVDGLTLRRGLLHRHTAGDLQSVRMVGHRRVLIASVIRRRRRSPRPSESRRSIRSAFADHRGTGQRVGPPKAGSRRDAPDLRAAQKVPPKLPSSLDICATVALFDRLFDGRRCTGVQNLADHARRPWSDARNSRQGAVGSEQVGQRPVQREDGSGCTLVAEHLLLRRLRERQIAKISAHHGVYVRIRSRLLHCRSPDLLFSVPSRRAAHGPASIPATIAVAGTPRARPSRQSPEIRSASSGTIRTRIGPTSDSR